MAVDPNELCQRVAQKDEEAFLKLYELYSPLVMGLAFRMLKKKEEAEEVLQNVFLYAWEHAANYNPNRGSVGAWFSILTRSRCLDKLRKESYLLKKEEPLQEEGFAFKSPALPALEMAERSQFREVVVKALETLPLAQRRVIEAAYFEGFTQQEMAEKFEEPLGTIKTRMRLGMLKLVELLQPLSREIR